jgi:predicted GNAT family acetyltransferase
MKFMTETSTAIRNNAARSRFELDTGNGIAFLSYSGAPGVLTFYHTEVPRSLRERGVGSTLVHGALQQVRAEGLKVVPRCGFVRHYIDTHPEFQDLVAAR